MVIIPTLAILNQKKMGGQTLDIVHSTEHLLHMLHSVICKNVAAPYHSSLTEQQQKLTLA